MRRSDRQITDIKQILDSMKRCDVCRIAFHDEEYPYIIPLNFGVSYENDNLFLYFHGAGAGKKIELLKKDNRVSFQMDCSHTLIPGKLACEYTMEYESICGNGILEIVDEEDKISALSHIMKQYDKKENHNFDENMVKAIVVLRLSIKTITGKQLKC